jgi:hypothetical protein
MRGEMPHKNKRQMNIATVKKASKRVDYPSIYNLGIIGYGVNNLYPQDLKNLVGGSDSAGSCISRYIDFIEGWGFADTKFAETKINQKGETADDLAVLISDDLANFSGFALHVNYNALGKIVEIQHIPFENCRLCEPNEEGEIAQIAVHIDWTGKTKRDNKIIKVCKENIDYIKVFNPIFALQEIDECGGIENYKGQILYISMAGSQTYPLPKHDKVIPQMSAEEGLGNISNLNIRNNFLPSGLLFINEAFDTVNKSNEGVQLEFNFDGGIEKDIAKIKSDENTSSIAIIRPNVPLDSIDNFFKFVNLKGNNFDKDFSETTKTATEKIYAAFNQEIFYRIRNGSMGFSSEIMSQAYEFYSTVTSRERRMIERTFDKIMKFWAGENFTDFTIKELIYISENQQINE